LLGLSGVGNTFTQDIVKHREKKKQNILK